MLSGADRAPKGNGDRCSAPTPADSKDTADMSLQSSRHVDSMAAKPGAAKPGAAPVSESGGNFVFRVQKFPNGAMYEGEWRNGKKDGRGTYTFADGSKFEGEFAGGLKHGRCVYRSS